MSERLSPVERVQKQVRFREELQDLINRHGMENGSNTPDYQLADYLIDCLRALDRTINARASWYGKFDKPGGDSILPVKPRSDP